VLAANLAPSGVAAEPAVPGLRGSIMRELGGVAVGLIGLTQAFSEHYASNGYPLLDPRAVLQREIETLRGQGAQLLVLLSHLGLAASPATEQSGEAPNALHDDVVATEFPQIAAIVGGHTHSVIETPLRSGDTVIVQAGEHGGYLGRLDLDVDEA